MGPNTVSAAEYFLIMLSQDKNIKFLGDKSAGAVGQPLVIVLPSGTKVFINTAKSYNDEGEDVSSGISPHYKYDFSEFYKTGYPDAMLSKFVKVIKELKE